MEGKFSEIKIWVNGTFDIVHIGHISLFEYAASLGRVRVGTDTDERVSHLKGNNRPFNKLDDRIKLLQSIKFIDSVVSFSSDEELIKEIKDWKPDYIVIGSDYKDKNIIGKELSKVIFFERIPNISTSKIIENR